MEHEISSAAALHLSYPQSELPDGVTTLERPASQARATSLAFLRFEKRDLRATEAFLSDFGMMAVERTDTRLVMRGANESPCIYVAEKARRSRFVGAAFTVAADCDLTCFHGEPSARPLTDAEIPGGGEGVELIDPAGHPVWLLRDWGRVPPLPVRAPVGTDPNTPIRSHRVNATIRAPVGPAQVVKLGHMVIQTTRFPEMADWYMAHLGLIPTDVQALADGSPALTFFRLDLGATPADHHALVLVGGLSDELEHSAYEVVDLDAIGQGQQLLRARGHRHMWGIGRHVLGSQLFDYWYDPDGFQFEHYADGDLFTADYETRYSPLEAGSIWAWGDDAPAQLRGKKSPALLLKVAAALWRGRVSLSRLKLIASAMGKPARPWL